MRVLIGCECSGIVRDAFRARGHDAYSCDLKPAEDESRYHFQCDILTLLDQHWDLAIFHPDCTYLCSSGLHWNRRVPGRSAKTEAAVEFAMLLWNAPIGRVAIENPRGRLGSVLPGGSARQIIQPYMFGDDASKETHIWRRGLPAIVIPEEDKWVKPRITVDGKKRWANQTDSGQNKLGPSEHRAADRSRTYPGIARALAISWG